MPSLNEIKIVHFTHGDILVNEAFNPKVLSIKDLKKEVPLKRKHWSGYWKYDKKTDKIFMHCHDGKIIEIRKTTDLLYTLGNVLSADWEVATVDNCPVLKFEINNKIKED